MDKNTRPMKDGQKVDNCPLPDNGYCLWCCKFWSTSGCIHPSLAYRKQLEDLISMREEARGQYNDIR